MKYRGIYMDQHEEKSLKFESVIMNYWNTKMLETKFKFLLALTENGISQKDFDFSLIESEYFYDFRNEMDSLWEKKKKQIYNNLPLDASEGRVKYECHVVFYNIIQPEYVEFRKKFLKDFNKKNPL